MDIAYLHILYETIFYANNYKYSDDVKL